MKTFITSAAVVAVLALFAGSVQAGGCGYGGGYGGYGGYNYCAPSYPQVQPYFVQPYCAPTPVWHDTSHFDWHPTQIIQHGCHYDVIPGHYDLHQTGHYHW